MARARRVNRFHFGDTASMMADVMAKKKPHPIANPWPERLRTIRDTHGSKGRKLLQSEAAAKLGVSRRSWIAWERGDTIPSNAYARLIGLTFKIKIN